MEPLKNATAITAGSLLNLPEELLAHIFNNLSQNDLALFCRTSRSCRHHMEPILYSVFVNIEAPSNVSESNQRSLAITKHVKLRRFLRTILQRPQLSSHIKVVELDSWDVQDAGVGMGSSSAELSMHDVQDALQHTSITFDAEQARLYDGASKRFQLSDQWGESLRILNYDAEIALLLLSAPNMTDLFLRLPDNGCKYRNHESFHFQTVFRRAIEDQSSTTSPIPKFDRLRNIEIDWTSSSVPPSTFTVRHVSDILQLPRLERLLTALTPDDWPDNPVSSPVSELRLFSKAPRAEEIVPMVESCKNLRHFDFSFGESDGMSFEDFIDSLSHRRDQLETLTIQRFPFEEPTQITPIASLRDFVALKQLDLSQDALLGFPAARPSQLSLFERLPPNLESIAISYGDINMLYQLKDLMGPILKPGSTVKTISFRYWYPCRYLDIDHLEDVPDIVQLMVFYKVYFRRLKVDWIINDQLVTKNDVPSIDDDVFKHC